MIWDLEFNRGKERKGSIQSAKLKIRFIVPLTIKGNVPVVAETVFKVNDAYVGSIGNDLLC